jgi:2-polyprenyl-6-methoxyphenol hydroxylase-like FAD-dependent oxidoreductase
MDKKLDTGILIVGSGPVGLFLANECARRKLRYKIIEARAGQSEHSKALAIFPRTLEIFDMAGIAPPFVAAANRVTSVTIITHGRTLARMPFAPDETPYPFVAMVPQNVSERLLFEELEKKGGGVQYETRFTGAIQDADGVDVTLEQQGKSVQLRAAFVVGCDGAHSEVRKAIGLTMEGGEYPDSFMLADIETNESLPVDELQLCPSEFGPAAIFPMSSTRRRLVATVEHPEGGAPTLAGVRSILQQRAPEGIEARALHWSSYFHIHHRHAPKLRVGRMFIAGDAAHIHSPFGGQGMNTGLHDVWNLVWKLDLYLNGHGTDSLLDTYTEERVPVIKSVIETTDLLTKVMGTPNRFAQALRNAVIPMVSRLAPFQHAFVKRLSELGIAYPSSPIVEGPGSRYLDDSMRGGTGIRSRFLVMANDTTQGLDELSSKFGEVIDLRKARRPGLTLVRPDGYVAYESHRKEDSNSVSEIESLLLKQAR